MSVAVHDERVRDDAEVREEGGSGPARAEKGNKEGLEQPKLLEPNNTRESLPVHVHAYTK